LSILEPTYPGATLKNWNFLCATSTRSKATCFRKAFERARRCQWLWRVRFKTWRSSKPFSGRRNPENGSGPSVLEIELAAFAFRAFSEALFFKDGRLFANDPYDTPLHISYINYLASGVAFWPADCIFSREPLHYPLGVDLFTGLFVIEGIPIQWCFFALGILASAAMARLGSLRPATSRYPRSRTAAAAPLAR
jgi:hypothetical protein